ncbi:MAG: hypothetical protein IJ737_03845 [Ruminococcus sp.]|nr:hypothetical protein [Ruminococcus sp.]
MYNYSVYFNEPGYGNGCCCILWHTAGGNGCGANDAEKREDDALLRPRIDQENDPDWIDYHRDHRM